MLTERLDAPKLHSLLKNKNQDSGESREAFSVGGWIFQIDYSACENFNLTPKLIENVDLIPREEK